MQKILNELFFLCYTVCKLRWRKKDGVLIKLLASIADVKAGGLSTVLQTYEYYVSDTEPNTEGSQ